MRKKLFIAIILIILILSPIKVQATNENIIETQSEELNLDNFINETENIVGEDINLENIFSESIQGKSSKNTIINAIGVILGKELKESITMIISILLIIIVHGILRSVSENLGNEQTGKIGYFIQIIILITILMKIYTDILNVVKESIETISSFVYMLIPVFISLTISTGNITTATATQSAILLGTNIITRLINQLVIPVVIIATVIGIISNISEEIHMNKLAKYMKSAIIWILCVFLTIFTCILTMESNLTQGVDQLTSKTTKTAVSTFVPVVGKILGDAVESVLGCSNIIRNAVGAVGTIAIILIGLMPLIRIGITMLFFYFAGGLAEIVSDKKIVYVLEQMGDSCKVLLAAIATVMVMLIIGITISMRVGLPT